MSDEAQNQLLAQAMQLHAGGQLAPAEKLYRDLLQRMPDQPDALQLFGVLCSQTNRHEMAVDLIRKSLVVRPDHPDATYNLGMALESAGRLEECIDVYRRACELSPLAADVRANLASVMKDLGRLDEAEIECRRAIEMNPSLAMAHSNLGYILREKLQYHDAITSYRRALALAPHSADFHLNLSLSLQLAGQYEEGFAEYEWRQRHPNCGLVYPRLVQPQWDGSSLAGKTLFIQAEQGMGDTMQFVRYAKIAQSRGGRVVIACQAPLVRLLSESYKDMKVMAFGPSVPAFDVQIPMMSLPGACGTRINSIPNEVPYLKAPATDTARWKARLTDHQGKKRVGLVWAGRAVQGHDRTRSMQLQMLLPLADVPNVQFFSLQMGPPTEQIKTTGFGLIPLGDELTDFADTAGLLENLDLLISVDTGIVHLAGGLARPVWTMVAHNADWRWVVDPVKCPWYPTMKLFTQTRLGDWSDVIQRVRDALVEFAST